MLSLHCTRTWQTRQHKNNSKKRSGAAVFVAPFFCRAVYGRLPDCTRFSPQHLYSLIYLIRVTLSPTPQYGLKGTEKAKMHDHHQSNRRQDRHGGHPRE